MRSVGVKKIGKRVLHNGVGQKKCNGYGLYDMSGNVQEWCFDVYSPDGLRYICRGGSWNDLARTAEVSHRKHSLPSTRHISKGVRFVRTIK